MPKILALSLLLPFAGPLCGQSTFYTHFRYRLDWGNDIFQAVDSARLNGVVAYDKTYQVKWDFGQLKMTGYIPILTFL